MDKLQQLTDEMLVKQYVNGCNEAFDALLLRHKDRLYSYILYFVKNNDTADDLFQETFVKAIINLRQGRYKEDGKFYPWLTRIAHNLLVDLFRNEKAEALIYCDEKGIILSDIDAMHDTYREAEMVETQTLEEVKHLIELLPAPQREIVHMRFYQELCFKEISEITGVSINTALGRMRYALINLRRLAEERHIFI